MQEERSGSTQRNQGERSDSSSSKSSGLTGKENVSDRNPNSNSEENRSGNDRGRQENSNLRNEENSQRSSGTGRDQNISSSNKEKGFREGQQDNQRGLESDTELPDIGKDDAEKTQRESPKM